MPDSTLFQQRILDKLERMGERLEELRDGHDDIKQILTGNGDPSKGLIVRIDRMEQSEKHRTWWLRAIASAVVGSVIASLSALFGGGK